MRSIKLTMLFVLIGCNGTKDAPPAAATTDAAFNDATPDPEPEPQLEEKAASAAADCAASETVLFTQRQQPIQPNAPGPKPSLTIHDNGHWTTNHEQSGCLSADQLAAFTEQLASAEISAPPLAPGMARCMAMPIMETTVEANGQTATWRSPCGPNNPSDSLFALMESIAAFTEKTGSPKPDDVADPNHSPLGHQ
ncbi:MAG: hypothetical protein AAFV53_20820 [Myxococcota bacterium]